MSIRIVAPGNNQSFHAGDPIDVIFEAQNIPKPFIYMLEAINNSKQRFPLSVSMGRSDKTHLKNVKWSTMQNDNKINRQDLPIGDYALAVSVFEGGHGVKKQKLMMDSLGQHTAHIIPIHILPMTNTQSRSQIHIISPKPGQTFSKDGPFEVEFETNMAVPFVFNVELPGNGGIIHLNSSDGNHVKRSFEPLEYYAGDQPNQRVTTPNKKIKSKQGQEFKINIHYPIDPKKSSVIKATASVNINII